MCVGAVLYEKNVFSKNPAANGKKNLFGGRLMSGGITVRKILILKKGQKFFFVKKDHK